MIKTYEPSIQYFPPTSEIKYGYLVYIPEHIKQSHIIVWAHGSNRQEGDYSELSDKVVKDIRNIVNYCNKLNLVAIMPVLPRSAAKSYPENKMDSQVMTAEVMINGVIQGNGFYKRPDLEVIKIVATVKELLKSKQIESKEKIIIGGISAGGSFANRFSLLHPQLVEISVPLIAGDFIYPTSEIYDVKLDYPYGVSNINAITDTTYSLDDFKKIKHLIYAGDEDKNPNFDALAYELNGDEAKVAGYHKVIGEDALERTLKYSKYLEENGVSVDLILGEGLGHEVNREILDQVFKRLNELV